MAKTHSNLRAFIVSLIPVILIVVGGYLNQYIANILYTPSALWNVFYYIIFGAFVSYICNSFSDKRTLYAYLMGILITLILILYKFSYAMLPDIMIFKYRLSDIIKLQDLYILLGAYVYNVLKCMFQRF